mmetsp:Transcript_139021/g.259234  ORF Transcript_139021/g.259234 Transcript_139021/m.259234 type:complete len:92 (+) Transcript_139021:821-1096(+)
MVRRRVMAEVMLLRKEEKMTSAKTKTMTENRRSCGFVAITCAEADVNCVKDQCNEATYWSVQVALLKPNFTTQVVGSGSADPSQNHRHANP